MFDIGFIFSTGWRATKEHYWVFLGVMMAFVGFQVPLGVLNTLVPFDADNGLGDLVGLFINPMLTVGWMYIGLQAYRRQTVTFGDLFIGFTQYWRMLGVTLLGLGALMTLGVACAVPVIIFAVYASMSSSDVGQLAEFLFVVLWGLPTIALLLFVGTRISYALILTFVTNTPVMGSLILSWRKTRPVWGRLMLLNFLLWLIAVASIVLLFLPLFFFFLPLLVGVVGVVCGLLLNEEGEQSADPADDHQAPENPAFPEPMDG
ncbi:MAG: hypothetical protein ACPGGL_08320 [Phycisphaerales bacterium]